MSVDFTKKKQVLVIHDVQAGSDDDLRRHEAIRKNVLKHLGGIALSFDAGVFKYEDISDEAAFVVKKALAALTGNRVAGWIVDQAVDVTRDVAIALLKGPTYELIKDRFKARIMASYDRQEPLFIVAHSLGTIYAFDAVNDLMKQDGLFQWNRRDTRPVQGLMTLGSPIAFDLFGRDWRSMTDLAPQGKKVNSASRPFPWVNFWDPTDPIVSGSLAGLPSDAKQFTRKFRERPYDVGWDVRSMATVTGLGHLEAHTAYWKDTFVGISLRSMMAKYGE